MNKENDLAGVKTITGLIGGVMVILKLSGKMDLDWVFVTLPFCVVTVVWTVCVIVGFIIGFLIGIKNFITGGKDE